MKNTVFPTLKAGLTYGAMNDGYMQKNVISLPEINTPRLKLRMLDGSDFEAVFKWGSDPLVNRFMLYPLYKNA